MADIDGNTLIAWSRVTARLFRTSLNVRAGRVARLSCTYSWVLPAGTYDFLWHVPLIKDGPQTKPYFENMVIRVEVLARVCASSSCVLISPSSQRQSGSRMS